MSIKNQSRLPIFALVIIGATVFSLLGLNYLVDKIAQKKPLEMAHRQPPPSPKNLDGRDDEVAPPSDAAMEDNGLAPRQIRKNGMELNKDAPEGLKKREENGGVIRRRRTDKGDLGGELSPPSDRTNRAAAQKDPKERNQAPSVMEGPKFKASERDLMEQDLERRRMMMDGPPQGYFPPDHNYYDGPYDGDQNDNYDDYDPDYDSRRDDSAKEDTKTSRSSNEQDYVDDPEDDPDYILEDEYINEFFDEEED